MRILHTIEGFGAKFGGIASCTRDLLAAMRNGKDVVELLTPGLRDHSDRFLGDGTAWTRKCVNDGIGPFNYSRTVTRELDAADYDIYHVNGLWQHIDHATCSYARKHSRPYVITPHGMLYPTALKISYWKKWPMLKLWFDRDIRLASCMHATCEVEYNHIRDFGYKGPVAIIGNPVNVPPFIDEIFSSRERDICNDSKAVTKIGFLGRLHPIKRIEAIIHGMAEATHRADVRLVVMGSGDKAYEEFLHREVKRLGLEKQVEFAGFVNGEEKFRKLSQLSALFVTSDMENFGMIVPEALLVGTPVMASLGTPWKELEDHNCGWWRDNSPESVARVIDEIAEKSPAELLAMGMRGRELVLEKYEASKVAAKMLQLYSWLLRKGEKPDFVHLS